MVALIVHNTPRRCLPPSARRRRRRRRRPLHAHAARPAAPSLAPPHLRRPGWWSETFLRVAAALPDRFQVSGMVVRREEAGRQLENDWGVATYRTVEAMAAAQNPLFVVLAVPQTASRASAHANVWAGPASTATAGVVRRLRVCARACAPSRPHSPVSSPGAVPAGNSAAG